MDYQLANSPNDLENEYALFYQSLTAPQDGMWDEIIGYAKHWRIIHQKQTIGFYAINEENVLLNFFLNREFLSLQLETFTHILVKHKIKKAITGTNHPVFLSACLDFGQQMTTHSYLFEDAGESTISPPQLNGASPQLTLAQLTDFQMAVKFCLEAIEVPREWLEGYYNRLIKRQELYLWQTSDHMIGVCEVRKSTTQPGLADIGMVVAKNYRRQGVGVYLLNQAKQQCYDQDLTPICSCEKDNQGSRKAIHKAGFVTKHRMVEVVF